MDCTQCRTADVPDISYDLFGTTYECPECGFIFQVTHDEELEELEIATCEHEYYDCACVHCGLVINSPECQPDDIEYVDGE